MKKVIVLLSFSVSILVIGLYFLIVQPQFMRKPTIRTTNQVLTSPTPTAFKPFTAKFEIYTNELKRDFSDSRYHNKSAEIYIESSNPEVIHVKKDKLTWSDFFNTLPMKVTNQCLTTGTGQVFCSNEKGKLRFFLNEIETPIALKMIVSPNDFLIFSFESRKVIES